MTSEPSDNEVIAWENFANFVRQLSHDLRNQLNAAELQAALIGELTTDPALKPEVLRLRALVSHLGTTLQDLSGAIAPPRPTLLAYAARDVVTDLQKRIARDFPDQAPRVKWHVAAMDSAMLNIDPGMIEAAATELFDNAFRHDKDGEIDAEAVEDSGRFVFLLREHNKQEIDPAKWNELLREVKHGHYGLGLRRARAILAAHGGELMSEFDASSRTLTSRIVLPCSPETR